jgi:hypothetical protein
MHHVVEQRSHRAGHRSIFSLVGEVARADRNSPPSCCTSTQGWTMQFSRTVFALEGNMLAVNHHIDTGGTEIGFLPTREVRILDFLDHGCHVNCSIKPRRTGLRHHARRLGPRGRSSDP